MSLPFKSPMGFVWFTVGVAVAMVALNFVDQATSRKLTDIGAR